MKETKEIRGIHNTLTTKRTEKCIGLSNHDIVYLKLTSHGMFILFQMEKKKKRTEVLMPAMTWMNLENIC